MGSLTRPAVPDELVKWIDERLAGEKPDSLILCLDSLLYGGLVSSRRSPDTYEKIWSRSNALTRWRQKVGSTTAFLAQVSIMRVSDNYDATEEKPYWARFGKEIFAWSALLHRLARGEKLPAGLFANQEAKIPSDIRQDYLQTRARNFRVCQSLVKQAAEPELIDFLVFSLDDSGSAGLNLMEAQRLQAQIETASLSHKISIYPGADEVILALFSRWLVSQTRTRPVAHVIFSPAEVAGCPSRYEGQQISDSVAKQLRACSIETTDNAGVADFIVLVHGNSGLQGDHITLPGEPDTRSLNTARQVAQTLEHIRQSSKPVVLCDVAYANGADPLLIDSLLQKQEAVKKLWSYAGWNTTGNTVGSALATGVARWYAGHKLDEKTDLDLKKCLFVRLMDDWAYQSVVRSTLTQPADALVLQAKMAPYAERVSQALSLHLSKLELSHPWQRKFEIEVAI